MATTVTTMFIATKMPNTDRELEYITQVAESATRFLNEDEYSFKYGTWGYELDKLDCMFGDCIYCP